MTTSTFTSPFDSDTDADFRAWGSQISAQLAAVGLTQTADTGQIDWTTVSVSGYPGIVGYEIWAFNDAAQATTPIVFKLEYGAGAAENPEMYLTVGGSSNGSGTIIGALLTTRVNICQASPTYSHAYPSYICYKAATGFLGVALKIGCGGQGQLNSGSGFCITRTNDTAGNVTSDGWNLYLYSAGNAGAFGFYSQNPSTPIQFPSGGNPASVSVPYVCTWPLNLSSSYADGSLQAVTVYALQPAIQVNAQLCVAQQAEIPVGNQFSLNVVGLTARNFISVGAPFGPMIYNQNQFTTCMIWE